ncbi:MAG: hypothetical protein ACXVP1_05710 [Thermoleophilia bacterium]
MTNDKVGWFRGMALAAIVALGLVAIVGSGGGAIGLPSDCPTGLDCSAPPPTPAADVQPSYVTAMVGAPVTFSAATSHTTGSLTYQWSRSTDGGVSFADIPGATGRTYSIAAVNLADDASAYRVVVTASNAVVQAVGHLAVSSMPGIVFQDGEFLDADWRVTPFADANAPAPAQTTQQVATGGNPGAWRRMSFQLPAGAGGGRVLYTSLPSTYDPAMQGAVYVIDYAEDGISLQPNTTTSTDSAILLEQGGRTYIGNQRGNSDFLTTAWSPIASRSSLVAADFGLLAGPACAVGERCPDFSAAGTTMRFGYWRVSLGLPGDTIAHGIDNWKVTVWRR